jgi:hypothetical protein
MTVLLRSICLDYPAGCGILRELLQNADDAGASRVVWESPCPFDHNFGLTQLSDRY